ncbi:general secretion pathway protein L [Collimonas sp. OK607]|uniref:type II secretion system protein GspL n=1 Tax=Collimonas sp. OK607 TaxID=1798194 RepID=UPI0008E69D01|nr:type II secretion system protein GspL [Collimonas sp. OK607]SFA87617.1 general secretion pathway protein L [Collimonas sp. OK607]
MSTLFIRLPARATLDSAATVAMPDCRFALVADSGRIERQGVEQLSGLAETIAAAARVVLILAAADVNLLQLQVPPLSDAKLKMALPNLVEEQLLVDPFDCVIVVGRKRNGAAETANKLRLIAVVQRDWLELLVKTLLALGARNLQAWPAQLCLPLREPETAVAAITDHGGDIDVAVRISAEQGIGWSLSPASGQSVAQEVLDGVAAILPQQSIILYVPQSSLALYQDLEQGQGKTTVLADDWSHWITGAEELPRSGMDLMNGLTASAAGTEFSWRRWRWPLRLAAALLLVNIVSLNYDWLRMRHEAASLRAGMMQSYRAAFPKETVIVDPIAQAKQKIAAAQRDGGQLAADDFLALSAVVGAAWAGSPQSADSTAISSLEYRDHHLLVRLKNAADADAAEAQVKSALESSQLTLSKPATGVWQIGGRK